MSLMLFLHYNFWNPERENQHQNEEGNMPGATCGLFRRSANRLRESIKYKDIKLLLLNLMYMFKNIYVHINVEIYMF
jgi:hypothetical protein